MAWLRPPLFVLVNGTFAVYLFFLISGVVLIYAFAAHTPGSTGIMRRVIRLGGPVVMAIMLSVGLLMMAPRAGFDAAALSGLHELLGALVRAPIDLPNVVQQVLLCSLMTGTDDTSLLPQFLKHVLKGAHDLRHPTLVACLVGIRPALCWRTYLRAGWMNPASGSAAASADLPTDLAAIQSRA